MKSILSKLAFILVMLVASCSFSAMAAPKDQKKVETIVYHLNPGMSCQKCADKIKSNLRFEKGVKAIDPVVADQTVTVKFDPRKTTSQAIVDALAKLGYGTTATGEAPAGEQSTVNCEK